MASLQWSGPQQTLDSISTRYFDHYCPNCPLNKLVHKLLPVKIDSNLFKQMSGNYIVVEVWTKLPKLDQDKLMGISKISLDIFYKSLIDKEIAR